MFNITHHQGNANRKHNEISFHTYVIAKPAQSGPVLFLTRCWIIFQRSKSKTTSPSAKACSEEDILFSTPGTKDSLAPWNQRFGTWLESECWYPLRREESYGTFSPKTIEEIGGFEHKLPVLLVWPCNKLFSVPNSDVLVYLASVCVGHTNTVQ